MERPQTRQYQIGDRHFSVSVLVPIQMRQLIASTKGLTIDWDNLDAEPLIYMLTESDITTRVVAILLREEGKLLKDKNLDELTSFLDESMDVLVMQEVIRDFLSTSGIWTKFKNFIESGGLLRLRGHVGKFMSHVNQVMQTSGSPS